MPAFSPTSPCNEPRFGSRRDIEPWGLICAFFDAAEVPPRFFLVDTCSGVADVRLFLDAVGFPGEFGRLCGDVLIPEEQLLFPFGPDQIAALYEANRKVPGCTWGV